MAASQLVLAEVEPLTPLDPEHAFERHRNRDALPRTRWVLFLVALLSTCVAVTRILVRPGTDTELAVPKAWSPPMQDWEALPGIEKFVDRAKSMDLSELPQRVLALRAKANSSAKTTTTAPYTYKNDPDDPGTFATMRTECFVDTWDASSCLTNAVIWLWYSLQCPGSEPQKCGVAVNCFVNSLAWMGSYLSYAASACGEATNADAYCAGDWFTIVGDFGQLTAGSLAMTTECNIPPDGPNPDDRGEGGGISSILGGRPQQQQQQKDCNGLPKMEALNCEVDNLRIQLARRKGRGLSAGPHLASPTHHADLLGKLQEESLNRTNRINRNFDIVACYVDVEFAISYLIRIILSLRRHSSLCKDSTNCGINVLNLISSFAWMTEYITLLTTDCIPTFNQKSLCAAWIIDLVASSTNLAATATATRGDCAAKPDKEKINDHLPIARRLASGNRSAGGEHRAGGAQLRGK